MAKIFSFSKKERLSSRVIIDDLFLTGNRFAVQPFMVYWKKIESKNSPVQVIISVSKRRFKKAVTRNYIKRRIKEAYRLNKNDLYQCLQKQNSNIAIAILYNSNDIVSYTEIENKIIILLQRLIAENEKSNY